MNRSDRPGRLIATPDPEQDTLPVTVTVPVLAAACKKPVPELECVTLPVIVEVPAAATPVAETPLAVLETVKSPPMDTSLSDVPVTAKALPDDVTDPVTVNEVMLVMETALPDPDEMRLVNVSEPVYAP
tara:strand:- start:1816 stop:2202 length:387 start_codon:yes stop_codon:yes gene_type:complete